MKRISSHHTAKSARDALYTYAWSKESKRFLEENPLCALHLKRFGANAAGVALATVVDHIVPHKGDQKLFWDRSNWQSLCKDCHDGKTLEERGATPHKPPASVKGSDVYGMPLDPNHPWNKK
jgi:5-methylcytosine-specific restriction protein A